jgi:hypothetical protein
MLALLLPGAPAQAQATRTWVSGVGDDANPCSRTAPCKTFAGAISKTATGGYINCLDPGGFGAVTITKAITIQCEEETGHSLCTGSINCIVVTVAAGANVTLRGLNIEGGGSGLNGVRLIQGGNLHLEEVVITGFVNNGIDIEPTAAFSVEVMNSFIQDVSGSTSNAGVLVKPASGGTGNVALNNVNIGNSTNGVLADGSGGGGGFNVNVRNSKITSSSNSGIIASSGSPAVTVMVDNTTVAYSLSNGVVSNGAQATVRIGSSTITNNVTSAARLGGSTMQSFKNNQIVGNTTDGTPITAVNSGGNILN